MTSGLTLGSIRHRRTAFIAGFVAVFLGSAVFTSFAALLDAGLQPGLRHADRITLIIMSSVVGGWGAIVVGAAVATTMAVTTRQRVRELALLRSIGATPSQVVRMITREVAVVGLAAVAVATPIGVGGSRVLLHLLKTSGQISSATPYHLGWVTFAIGAGAPLLAALLATWITARRAAHRAVRDGLFDAATGGRTTSAVRIRIGWILLAGAVGCAFTTPFVCTGDPASSQSIASEGAIAGAVAFALLAPVLLAATTRRIAPILERGGVAGHLALLNLRERTQQAATPIMPIVLLTGIASGTLSMQSVANVVSGAHLDKGTQLLNYVIVGIISALAAAMLINLLTAAISERRREYAQTRLLGATSAQLHRALMIETAVVTALGLGAGTVAAAFTAIPFSLAQGTGLLPPSGLVIHGAVLAAVAGLTFASVHAAGRHTMGGHAMTSLVAVA